MDRSPELRLPTVAVPVTLAMVGMTTTDAELFVADVPRVGRGQLLDDLAAVLDDETRFVPARVGADVQLVAKHALSWVSVHQVAAGEVSAEIEFADVPSEVITLHDRQHRVTIDLIVGGRLEGTLLDSSPYDRPRVVDHLNGVGQFVRLWASNAHFLINKAQILQVTELHGSRSSTGSGD